MVSEGRLQGKQPKDWLLGMISALWGIGAVPVVWYMALGDWDR